MPGLPPAPLQGQGRGQWDLLSTVNKHSGACSEPWACLFLGLVGCGSGWWGGCPGTEEGKAWQVDRAEAGLCPASLSMSRPSPYPAMNSADSASSKSQRVVLGEGPQRPQPFLGVSDPWVGASTRGSCQPLWTQISPQAPKSSCSHRGPPDRETGQVRPTYRRQHAGPSTVTSEAQTDQLCTWASVGSAPLASTAELPLPKRPCWAGLSAQCPILLLSLTPL